MKKINFTNLKKGEAIIIDWKDPTTLEDENGIIPKEISKYYTPTRNIGFYVMQDKESVIISNMTYDIGKLEKFNSLTVIPKVLIINIKKLNRGKKE